MEHTLSNGRISVTLTTLGGTFSSIRDAAGTERLWQPNPDVWTGQAPICFPICGGLRDGHATTLSGKEVELPRHGFARKHEFALGEKDDGSVSLVLESDEKTIVKLMGDQRMMAVAAGMFVGNCAACHARDGGGINGVNLTDDSYKNVKTIADVYTVITDGAASGAMPSWRNKLNQNERVLMAAYAASLRGTTPAVPKGAEGTPIAPWPKP